jgi:hypothetical protein
MAINQQPPQGPLAQASRPAAPAPKPAPVQGQQPPRENLAARAAGMEQEEPDQPQDYFTKSIEDLRRQRESLNSQIQSLKSSLDSRKGLPFDPVLMSAAAGFLKPTKTGSFGESLGYASELMSNEAEKEYARRQAAAKLGLELDEKALALQTKGLEMEDLLRMSGMGGAAPRAPGLPTQVAAAPGAPRTDAGPAVPAGGPVGGPVGGPAAPGAAPAGKPVSVGMNGAPNQMPRISDADITRAYAISKEHGDRIAAIAKAQREDIKDIGGRPFSTSRETFLPGDPNKPTKYDFGRFIGTKDTDAGTVEEYKRVRQEALDKNDPNIEFNWFKRQGWLEGPIKPTKEEVAAGKGQPGEGKDGEPLSLEERERRGKLREKRGEAEITEEKDAISKIRTGAGRARELNNVADSMITYAKSNPRAFELLQNTTIKDAIFRAAEKGITTPGGSIAFPARELESYKLKPEDREALMMFMQAYAQQTVTFRKEARAPGEGATTEAEGLLFSQLGALPSDTARVVIMKSEALKYKAEYDRQLLRTWNKWRRENPDGTYNEFLDSDNKNTLDDAYDKKLNEMRQRNSDILGTVKMPKDGEKKGEAKPSTAPKPVEAPKPAEPKPVQAGGKQPPRITGNDDPVYKNLQPGQLYIAPDGTVKTKR